MLALVGRRIFARRAVLTLVVALAVAGAIAALVLRGGGDPERSASAPPRGESGTVPEEGGVVGIRVGREPDGIATGEGAVWVTNSDDDTVSRIDPERNRTVGEPIAVGDDPQGVAVGAGEVWVANSGDDTVSRIDPVSNVVVGEAISVGREPRNLAFGAGAVWAANAGGEHGLAD